MSTPSSRYLFGKSVKSNGLYWSSFRTFPELYDAHFLIPRVLKSTKAGYQALTTREEKLSAKDGLYLIACTLDSEEPSRAPEHRPGPCNLVFIDIDDAKDARSLVSQPDNILRALSEWNFAAYTTASSTPENPRLRVVVDADSIPADQYGQAVHFIASKLGLQEVTGESLKPKQPMVLPSIFSDDDLDSNPEICSRLDGRALKCADFQGHTFDSSSPSPRQASSDDESWLEFLRLPDPSATPELVKDALRHIDPDCMYPEWVEKAMQLKHQFPEEIGFGLFNDWSQTGTKYEGEEATWKKWTDISPSPKGRAPKTIKSLFWQAKQAGWSDPRQPANSHVNAADQDSLLAKLDKRRLHLSEPPSKPVPVYSLAGQQVSTAGNLTVISAQAKAGKTAVMGALLASVLGAEDGAECCGDFLGFTAAPHNGKAVIYFDTEQAPYDAWTLLQRASIRAACDTWPENFRFYSLADVGTPERRKMLVLELERAAQQCGGIHSVFVDGVADLCLDPNDTAESFNLVEEFQSLAIEHHCPLITVLHENPSGAETGKTRGHLGSQLERKAESNLRVVKDPKGICTIYSERCRRASIPKEQGPRFTFDVKAGMHLTYCGDVQAEKTEAKRQRHQALVDKVFLNSPPEGLHFDTLKAKIMASDSSLQNRTARRRINDWKDLQLVQVTPSGKYQQTINDWC